MIIEWEKRDDCWTNIGSLGLVREQKLRGYFETRRPVLLDLSGHKKTVCGCCGKIHWSHYDKKVRRVRDLSCGDARIYLEVEVRRVLCRKCKKVKREKLEWLEDNPFYTKRFAYSVGRRKGHTYRIVVSDLERGRPIWFGGKDRSKESLDIFYQWLGAKKVKKIRLAVMDMWKAFEKSTRENAFHAAILYDKFHVMMHLGEALDKVRKMEYARLSGKERSYIKGQKYTLLSNRENLTLDGRKALKKLLMANKRLNTAYLLKESFGQLWSYKTEGWSRRFFDNGKDSLKWQRLKPYEKFAEMIEKHWDGIAAYSRPENKVPLGFVEGLNNKIRVIQRRAYGLRDEEYLRLKILTCMLPEI